MKRRHRSVAGASLELLLDTMCNAFGGVMFIAILLVILSQFARIEPAREEARADALRGREVRLAAELHDLRSTLRRRRERLEAVRSLRRNLPIVEQLRRLRGENAEIQEELARLEAEESQEAEEADTAGRELRQARAEAARLEARVDGLLAALEEQERESTRELRMPRIRRIQKAPFWMIVKNDRLYLLYLPQRSEVIGGVNTDDVRHRRYGNYIEFEAVPGKGVDLAGAWKDAPLVRRILAHVSGNAFILYFAVYPDSYATFRELRDFFVERGYDYYWSIQPDMDSTLRLQFVSDRWFEGM